VNVVVVGCGYWGQNLVRNFAELGALGAVCETRPDGQERARSIAPAAKLLSDYDEALAIGSPLVIATPAETHYALAKRALMSGRDVFVEKPLALTFKEGQELVRLADERGRILMVGHVLEYHPGVKRLLELVRDELGQIYYVYSTRLSLGKVRREENILWSFAPHDVAAILRIVGRMPTEVAAAGGSYLQPGIADVTLTTMLFEDGVRAHIHVSWLHPYKEQRLVVIGSKKMASFDDVSKRLEIYDRRVELVSGDPVPIRGDGVVVPFDATEPLRRECAAFLDAVQTRVSPLTDGATGLRVLEVLEAAQRSLERHGAPVALQRERALSGSPA
jgi:predicted dehydrogenase